MTENIKSEEALKMAKHRTAICVDEAHFHPYFETPSVSSNIGNDKTGDANRYNPEDYLQTNLKLAVVTAKKTDCNLILGTSWLPILLLPKSDETWLDADEGDIKHYAEQKIPWTECVPVKMLNYNEAEQLVGKTLHRVQNIDALLWKSACWASKGRYPAQIDYRMPVYLKIWPNFTRLLITPHALAIAALLVSGARTMANIAETLKINPQYVFIFISAASAIDLTGQARRNCDLLLEPPRPEPHELRDLFKRIIKKLNKPNH